MSASRVSDGERLRRWRLVLGGEAETSTDAGLLGVDDRRVDAALGALYDSPGRADEHRGERRGARRSGGLARSAPSVARWLGDIRRYFPTPIVQVLQRDAIERLDLRQLLLEPELLAAVEPDVELVAMLVELNRLLPAETKATARAVVQTVVDQLVERLAERTRAAVAGSLARVVRTARPRPADIDWGRTIAANLRHWIPEHRTVVPERLVGSVRRRPALARDVIVAVDQSASMADSVVYASLFACVLAALPALRTSLVAFDTNVADLSDQLADPVDVLFGVQLGGGTDIANALGYVGRLVERPAQTLVVLVSDLHEGGSVALLRRRTEALVRAGVTVLVLLALSDSAEGGGRSVANQRIGEQLAALGAIVTWCTPDAFPDVLADALAHTG